MKTLRASDIPSMPAYEPYFPESEISQSIDKIAEQLKINDLRNNISGLTEEFKRLNDKLDETERKLEEEKQRSEKADKVNKILSAVIAVVIFFVSPFYNLFAQSVFPTAAEFFKSLF